MDVQRRWKFAIRNAVGHFDLFFDIVEANSPGTYNSAAEDSIAVKTYLHRRRENQAKLLKLRSQIESNDEEVQENNQ